MNRRVSHVASQQVKRMGVSGSLAWTVTSYTHSDVWNTPFCFSFFVADKSFMEKNVELNMNWTWTLTLLLSAFFFSHRWLESAGGSTSLNSSSYLTRYEMMKMVREFVLHTLAHHCWGYTLSDQGSDWILWLLKHVDGRERGVIFQIDTITWVTAAVRQTIKVIRF